MVEWEDKTYPKTMESKGCYGFATPDCDCPTCMSDVYCFAPDEDNPTELYFVAEQEDIEKANLCGVSTSWEGNACKKCGGDKRLTGLHLEWIYYRKKHAMCCISCMAERPVILHNAKGVIY